MNQQGHAVLSHTFLLAGPVVAYEHFHLSEFPSEHILYPKKTDSANFLVGVSLPYFSFDR